MSNKKLGAILLGVAVVLMTVFGVLIISQDDKSKSPQSSSDSEAIQSETTPVEAQESEKTSTTNITTQEVAGHSSESDCWTIIDGSVYDITKYIPRHPGGDEILRACGTDGTSLFQQRKTSSGESVGSGQAHSSNASDLLSDFKKGELAD
jgi:cytochrome b involved in lipid metabolism